MISYIITILKAIFRPGSLFEGIDQKRKRWYDQYRQLQHQREMSSHLIWAMRRMERAGFLSKPRTREQMVEWLRNERAEVLKRNELKAAEEAKKFDREMPRAPQIKDDSIEMLEASANILEVLAMPIPEGPVSPDNHIPHIEFAIAQMNISKKENLRAMILEIQLSLDDVANLVCRPEPNWEDAGNIIMPLYETHFELGIKHEILRHVRNFGPDGIGDPDEFKYKLEQHVLDIETRLEKAKKELDEKGLSYGEEGL